MLFFISGLIITRSTASTSAFSERIHLKPCTTVRIDSIPVQPEIEKSAVASTIFGIASAGVLFAAMFVTPVYVILPIGFILGFIAFGLGIRAIRRLKKSVGGKRGRLLAIIGVSWGSLVVLSAYLVGLAFLLVFLTFPRF
jgi:hypothetical protein